MNLKRLMIAAAWLVTAPLLAEPATFVNAQERWFPEGWTEPEVVNNNGSMSFKPSIPSGFKQRQVGAVINVGNSSAHRTVLPPMLNSHGGKDSFKLLLRDGREMPVQMGKWTNIDGVRFRVLHRKDGYYYLERLYPARTWRFRRMDDEEAASLKP